MSRRLPAVMVALAVGGQIAINSALPPDPAEAATLGPPPSALAARVHTLDDPEAAHRILGLRVQGAGEGGAEVIPLNAIPWRQVAGWLETMQALAPDSHFAPMLARYHFGAAARGERAAAIARFLGDLALRDPARHWPWLAEAADLARHRAGDEPLALELTLPLARLPVPGIPAQVRQIPVLLLLDRGQKDAARALLTDISMSETTLSPADRRYLVRLRRRLGMPTP